MFLSVGVVSPPSHDGFPNLATSLKSPKSFLILRNASILGEKERAFQDTEWSQKIFTISFWIVTIVFGIVIFESPKFCIFPSIFSFFFSTLLLATLDLRSPLPKKRVLCNRDIQDQPRILAKLSESTTLAGLPAMLEEINSKQLERYQKDQQRTNKNEQNLNKKPTKKSTLGTCQKIKQNRVPRRAIFTTTASTSWCFFLSRFCRDVRGTRWANGGPFVGDHFFHRAFHMIKVIHSKAQNRQDWKTHLSVEV